MPLLLLALGLGIALTAYEFSPRFHVRVDDYARAIRRAHAAHAAAEAHLANASTATATAARHAQASLEARQSPFVPMPLPAPVPQAPPVPMPLPPQVQQAPRAPAVPPPPPPSPAPAQSVAEAHDSATQVAIDASVDHAADATVANQAAAKNTADAAKAAKTEAERRQAAQSAAKVLEREKKIAQALATLGMGECGVRSYPRITPRVIDALFAKLRATGMVVTGDNPWNIDTHDSGVKLRAAWDPGASTLKLVVTSTGLGWCSIIWDRLEPKLKEVIGG